MGRKSPVWPVAWSPRYTLANKTCMPLALHADSAEAMEARTKCMRGMRVLLHYHMCVGCCATWSSHPCEYTKVARHILTRKLGWQLNKRPDLLKVTLVKKHTGSSAPGKKYRTFSVMWDTWDFFGEFRWDMLWAGVDSKLHENGYTNH